MGHITVNPLLSPPGRLFFSSTFEGGLNREGGLKSEGGGGLFNTNTRCATKDHFASAGPRSS